MAVVIAFLASFMLAVPQADADVERQARELEARLIAPCCFSQQVSVHQSPAADQVRKQVRAMLREGRTSEEILDAYVAEYGVRILAEPPARGYRLTLYVLPVVLLVLTAALLAVVVKRMAGRASAETAVAAETGRGADRAYEERLAEDLRDLD